MPLREGEQLTLAQLMRYGQAGLHGVRFSEAHAFNPPDGSAGNWVSAWEIHWPAGQVTPTFREPEGLPHRTTWRSMNRAMYGGDIVRQCNYWNEEAPVGDSYAVTVEYAPTPMDEPPPVALVPGAKVLWGENNHRLNGWVVCSYGRHTDDYRRKWGEYVVRDGKLWAGPGVAVDSGRPVNVDETWMLYLVKPEYRPETHIAPRGCIPLRDLHRLLAAYPGELDGVTMATVSDGDRDNYWKIEGNRIVFNPTNFRGYRAGDVSDISTYTDRWVMRICDVPYEGYTLDRHGPRYVPPRSERHPNCPVCFMPNPGSVHDDGHGDFCLGGKVAAALGAFALGETCPTCHTDVWRGTVKQTRCEECRSRLARTQRDGAPPDWFRFGVEVETEGLYHGDKAPEVVNLVTSGPKPWECKPDGSLRGPMNKKTGRKQDAEVVSPPLPFTVASLEQVRKTVHRLRQAGARAGTRCGLHVHVDCTALTYKQLGSLAEWWFAAQNCVVNAHPIGHERSSFCKMWKSTQELHLARHYTERGQRDRMVDLHGGDRYSTLNYQALSKHNTVEFRLFNGTVHAGKIRAYITFAVHLVSKASRDVRNGATPVAPYEMSRAGMLKLLNDLEITSVSARYHLLGKWATDEDRPTGKE